MFTNRENQMAKTLSGDFQVTTPKTPLLSQQAVTSQGIPSTLPTYSWTLTPIPNWTCSVVTVPLFDARLSSTWLTNYADPSMRLQTPTKWRKIWFCIPYKTHSESDIHGSISFMIDNMHYRSEEHTSELQSPC